MIKFARGKAPFLVKQIVELDRSAPSHLHRLDLQTSLRLGHTQSCQGKAPGSHLLPALLVLGMESALSRYITRTKRQRYWWVAGRLSRFPVYVHRLRGQSIIQEGPHYVPKVRL
ncbi:hypothetical protein NC651_022256 [Populus alba x Populus x berolinensis]|nr:hypothetical protein NC651_022256 [Populus alba x Populus x berolinensis]